MAPWFRNVLIFLVVAGSAGISWHQVRLAITENIQLRDKVDLILRQQAPEKSQSIIAELSLLLTKKTDKDLLFKNIAGQSRDDSPALGERRLILLSLFQFYSADFMALDESLSKVCQLRTEPDNNIHWKLHVAGTFARWGLNTVAIKLSEKCFDFDTAETEAKTEIAFHRLLAHGRLGQVKEFQRYANNLEKTTMPNPFWYLLRLSRLYLKFGVIDKAWRSFGKAQQAKASRDSQNLVSDLVRSRLLRHDKRASEAVSILSEAEKKYVSELKPDAFNFSLQRELNYDRLASLFASGQCTEARKMRRPGHSEVSLPVEKFFNQGVAEAWARLLAPGVCERKSKINIDNLIVDIASRLGPCHFVTWELMVFSKSNLPLCPKLQSP